MNRSHMGRRNRQRGYEYEHWLEKNLYKFGFTETKKQPLSGALDRPEFKGDVPATFNTDDGHIYKFLFSAKRTSKWSINFATEWITEIVSQAEAIERIPGVMFALEGRPRIRNYIVIPEYHFIGIVGNTNNIIVSEMKNRGKKYITMKKADLERELYDNQFDLPMALRFDGPEGKYNLLFTLEDFVSVI